MDSKYNKQIVLNFYRNVIRDHRFDLIDEYVHDDYVQHSASLKGGKAGLIEALSILKTLPKPPKDAPSPIAHIVAEGDLVMVHLNVTFMGKHRAIVDIFRLSEGRLAEHWSVEQDMPDIVI